MTTLPAFTTRIPPTGTSSRRPMTALPENTTVRPAAGSEPDVLSDVLRAVRLTGAVFFSVEGIAPWAFEGPASIAVAPLIRPGVERVVQFHAIASGSCWGGLIGEAPVQLHAGDVIVLPLDNRHVLSSAPGIVPTPVEVKVDPDGRTAFPLPIRLGGTSGDRCEVICGFLGCDTRPFNPLFAALPRRMLVARGAEPGSALGRLIALAREELGRPGPGRQSALARLSELMFVEALRRYVEASPERTGWLAGMSDALVGRALSALHCRPGAPWTLDGLAREVGTSRSVLAERFGALLGVPPMQYLAQWRMQLATDQLSCTQASIAEIAAALGYGSEAALSRAFKRIVGVSPSDWRRGRTGPGS